MLVQNLFQAKTPDATFFTSIQVSNQIKVHRLDVIDKLLFVCPIQLHTFPHIVALIPHALLINVSRKSMIHSSLTIYNSTSIISRKLLELLGPKW